MRVAITESDFDGLLRPDEQAIVRSEAMETVLGDEVPEKVDTLMRKLPAAIARIVRSCEVEGFEVSEFQVEVEVSGKPFQVGISSKGIVTYKRVK